MRRVGRESLDTRSNVRDHGSDSRLLRTDHGDRSLLFKNNFAKQLLVFLNTKNNVYLEMFTWTDPFWSISVSISGSSSSFRWKKTVFQTRARSTSTGNHSRLWYKIRWKNAPISSKQFSFTTDTKLLCPGSPSQAQALTVGSEEHLHPVLFHTTEIARVPRSLLSVSIG